MPHSGGSQTRPGRVSYRGGDHAGLPLQPQTLPQVGPDCTWLVPPPELTRKELRESGQDLPYRRCLRMKLRRQRDVSSNMKDFLTLLRLGNLNLEAEKDCQ